MPDADDFDVEYFRNLMKGNSPKETHPPPAEPARPAAKKRTRRKCTPAAAADKSKAAAGRKPAKRR